MDYNLYAAIIKILSVEKSLSMASLSSLIPNQLDTPNDVISQLIEFGCLMKSDQNDELKLSKIFDIYCHNQISAGVMPKYTQDGFVLTLFVKTDSTNTYLKSISCVDESLQVCLAEQQTNGRGRRGKVWFSPFAENIYMSLRKKINVKPMDSGGLSIVVGLAVIKALEELRFTELQLKWPNDVYFQGEKIAGVLIEAVAIKNNSIEVVVGVGVNVMMTAESSSKIDQQWTDLFQASQNNKLQYFPPRNEIVTSLINQICLNLVEFEQYGLDFFKSEWLDHDYLLGKNIIIQSETGISSGKAIGINSIGELLMKNAEGVTKVNAGEVSVRLSPEREKG